MEYLNQKELVPSMQGSDSFIVEVSGGIRRVTLNGIRETLASSVVTPPTTFTLEQNSNSAFTVSNQWAAQMYQSYMGGYMMKVKDGKVYSAKLNSSDWNYFADGAKVDDASKYETMVHVPKCHFRGSGQTLNFGGLSEVAGGHVFGSPEWVGAYLMYVDANGVAHSRPDVAPSHSKPMSTFWSHAQKLGKDFGEANYGFTCLINALYQASFGNLNSQQVIGNGWYHSNWQSCRDVPMGLTRSLGDGSGSVLYNDATVGNQYPTKLFGFEDLWSKLWEFRPGIRFYMDGDTRYAVVYDGNVVSNTADGRKFVCLSSASGHFATKMQLGEYWDMIPLSISGGSNTTYYCDGAWAATGGQLLCVGGLASSGSACGLSCSRSNSGFSDTSTVIGSRLAFYGQPIEISGTKLMAL